MKTYSWFEYIAIIFLLIGIYAAVHTAANFAMPSYPQTGVLAFNTSGNPPIIQRVSDCTYNQTYYSQDGTSQREPTATEKKQAAMDKQRCIDGINETVQQVKIMDIASAAFFLFMGIGLLSSLRLLRTK